MIPEINMKASFYVYVYYCPNSGDPVYVGKGSGDRYKVHMQRKTNRYLHNKIKKWSKDGLYPEIRITFWTENESEAFEEEMRLIRKYGRKCDGGSLCNFSIGGEGPSYFYFPEEYVEKLGTLSDIELSEIIGCAPWNVRKERIKRGIPLTHDNRRRHKIENYKMGGHNKVEIDSGTEALLGTMTDKELSEISCYSVAVIRGNRERKGIKSFAETVNFPNRYKKGQESDKKDKRLWHLINEKTGESFVGWKSCFEKRYGVPSTNMAKLERGAHKSVARGFVLVEIEELQNE